MTPSELPCFADRPARRRFVREERGARPWGERPAREPAGERFQGEAVLRDLPQIGAEAMAALRILARYAAVRALATADERSAKEARRAAFVYLAALEGADEAQALRRAIVSPAHSGRRYAALMQAGREAEKWEQWHGAYVVRRLAWEVSIAGRQRRAAARAARALGRICRHLGRTGDARRWRRRWKRLSAEAGS